MEVPGPNPEQDELMSKKLEEAFEVIQDPIETARQAINGNRTIIVTDASGVDREVIFVE